MYAGGESPSSPPDQSESLVTIRRTSFQQREYDRILSEVRYYIDENYGDSSLSLDEFCVSKGHSRRSVQRALHSEGTSWRELLRARRLEAACGLLAGSELPIAVVAKHAGYSHSSHLGRALAEQLQISPVEYRASYRNEGDDNNGSG